MVRKSKMQDMIEEIRMLAQEVPSRSELLRRIGYHPQNAGNHRTLKLVAERNDIVLPDGSGTSIATKRIKKPLSELLVLGSTMSSYHLKNRLLSEGILEPVCSAPFCPLPNPSVNPFTGESTDLKLALDHIDGNNRNNVLTNLRLLCYHCHGLTDTYCNSKRGQ